jgi:hypothetical protein
MCISIRQMMPCHILGLTHCVNILEEDTVEIMISAIVSAFTCHPFFLLPSLLSLSLTSLPVLPRSPSLKRIYPTNSINES